MAFDYDPSIYQRQADENAQYAQQNQDFWNKQLDSFNPKQKFLTNQNTQGAYGNIAANAQARANEGRQAAGMTGGGGGLDYSQLGRNLGNQAQQTSKTEDLNAFLNNMSRNKQLSDERLSSMFGGSQRVGAARRYQSEGLPQQAALRNAQTQQGIEDMWNNYYSNQPNMANQIGGALGDLGGTIAGNKLGNLFGSQNQNVQVPPPFEPNGPDNYDQQALEQFMLLQSLFGGS